MELNENILQQTNTNENENEMVNDNQQYIDAINEMRKNSISKDKYDKLLEENKQLINALKEGNQVELVNPDENKPSLQELAEKLCSENFEPTNAEGWKTALEFRKAMIDAGFRDPFLPNSRNYTYKEEDSARSQLISDTLEKMIDDSQGNPDMFNALGKQYIKDDRTLQNKNKR